MNTQIAGIAAGRIVSPQEWVLARKELLAKEKELTRLRDELSRQRRELPWEKVEKSYVFDGPNGKESLADLFGGRSQLVVYHFMFGPEWQEGCPSCSMVADHLDGSRVHLAQRDVTLVVVSRARQAQIEAFQQRMGWRFKWVSSLRERFQPRLSGLLHARGDGPGQGALQLRPQRVSRARRPPASASSSREDGEIFHTYSAYARGVEELLGVYSFLDFTPKGRDEESLPFPMAWVRHHDRYEPRPR